MKKNNLEIPQYTTVPKMHLDQILHYLLLDKIKKDKERAGSPFGKKRHLHYIFQYHKNFQMGRRLKGSALTLLKTQYAKKPRNPE